ncbi:hypothetical protein BFW01_g9975 [Lasiodiplodia theobromae]|nr:hypothetical protein BFW01_g9975 [Lasiodiplodia theobromae]
MARDQNALTYRVRRLPPEIDKPGVVELLTQSLATEDCVPTIHVYSLCRSLDSPETTSAKEATVTFSALPSQLQGREEWSLTAVYHSVEHHVVVDKQFLDFTVLSEVPDDEHILDCVAISGLGSHPFGSWQQRGNPDFMWLRDALPKDLNGIRTIIYGYDTHLTESKSFKSTYDIALALANRLVSVGFGWPSAKPVVFLCHSLGGIIFKETVVILASTSAQEPSFLGKLRAALFFGVPNAGMEITQLRTMVKGDPTEQLIEDLAPRSPRLSSLDSLFSGHQATRDFRVVSFYETETTKTVHFLGSRWVRNGPEVVMVEKESAIQKCSRHPDEVHFIDKDHSAMVKFSRGDVGYTRVVESLRKFLRHEDVFTFGLRRQTTDISFASEESDGQNQDGEIHTSAIQQKVRAKWFKRRSEGMCSWIIHQHVS